jgi:hypothetical protein
MVSPRTWNRAPLHWSWSVCLHFVVPFLIVDKGLVSTILYHVLLRRENAARDRGERDEVIVGLNDKPGSSKSGLDMEELARRNGRFASVEEAKTVKGDGWSGYRYIL